MNAVTGGGGLLGTSHRSILLKNLLPEGVRNFLKGGKNFIGDGLRKTGQFFNNLNPFKSKTSEVSFWFNATQDAVRGARQGTKVLASVADASKGLRGISKTNAALNIASAGLEFGFRKAEGQTNTQAAVGTAADAVGGMAGFAVASKATATALSPLLVTPVPGARILYGVSVLGAGILGSMGWIQALAAGAADKLTGADKVGEDLEKFNEKEKEKKEEQEKKKRR